MKPPLRKHILFLSWKDIQNPSSGGAEIVTDAFASHLAAHHDVTYITSSFPHAPSEEYVHGYQVIRKGTQLSSIFHAFFIFRALNSKKKFDLIIDQVHGIPFFSVLYPNQPAIITIVYEIAGELWGTILPHSAGKLIDTFWLFLYRRVSFFTISNSTKQELIAHNIPSHHIAIIPLFTEIAPQKISAKSNQPTLIVLGRIAPGKRIEYAIKAFFIIKKTIPSLRLIIIGKKEEKYHAYFQDVQKLAAQDADITIIQNADEQTKISWLAQSHIHIMPSKKEGYGIAILEAAMCSTPSIGYRVPGIQDAIIHKQTGILVDHQTPEDLATAIRDLLNDPAMLHRLQQQAFVHAQQYTKNQTVASFMNSINSKV